MIRAVMRNGSIEPVDPLPLQWVDGKMLNVTEANQVETDTASFDVWWTEWERLGSARYEQGEREAIQRMMDEADRQAKDMVARQMGLVE